MCPNILKDLKREGGKRKEKEKVESRGEIIWGEEDKEKGFLSALLLYPSSSSSPSFSFHTYHHNESSLAVSIWFKPERRRREGTMEDRSWNLIEKKEAEGRKKPRKEEQKEGGYLMGDSRTPSDKNQKNSKSGFLKKLEWAIRRYDIWTWRKHFH